MGNVGLSWKTDVAGLPDTSYSDGMFSDEIIAVIAEAIKSEVAHPLGAMRHLPASEEKVALTILNALDEAGFNVVSRGQQPSA